MDGGLKVRDLRGSEHEQDGDSCASLDGNSKLKDRVEREDQQYGIERHAGAVQRHMRVVIGPVIAIEWPFQGIPGLIQRPADNGRQDREYDQIDAL